MHTYFYCKKAYGYENEPDDSQLSIGLEIEGKDATEEQLESIVNVLNVRLDILSVLVEALRKVKP